MIKITHQEVSIRYDTLSDVLKDAGFSIQNVQIIRRIGEENHLSYDKVLIISELVGYILFGFIHPEDLAKEIRESLNLNPEIANSIADEIDRKIFAPIRIDLEKVYAPPSEEEVLDLRTKTEEKPQEPAVKVELPISGEVRPPEVKPQYLEVEPPEIKEPKKEVQLPKVEISEKPPAVSPSVEVAAGEAEPPVVSEAEPFIIHKEAEFKPLSETKKSLGGLFGFLKKKGERLEEKAEPARAQVEIGDKSLKTEPSKITKTEPPKVRVVHYTEFQPAVSPFPEAADQRRQERGPTQTDIKIETERFLRESALSPRESALSEVKPPENLPVVNRVEPLDLRQAPVEAKPAPGIKPVSEKKAPTLAEGEVGVSTAKRVGEEEEMIDLSTFKKI
jgi:hypothetical protein